MNLEDINRLIIAVATARAMAIEMTQWPDYLDLEQDVALWLDQHPKVPVTILTLEEAYHWAREKQGLPIVSVSQGYIH